MKLEIDMPEHHYNSIIAFDSVSLGRVPYKGIIMYAINAIKRGKAIEQEPTTKNNLGVDAVSRHAVLDLIADYDLSMGKVVRGIHALPSVTPQERKGHWTEEFNDLEGEVRFTCSSCGKFQLFGTDFCYHCGAKMIEPKESEG